MNNVFEKLENVILKMELEDPVGNIQYLAVSYDGGIYEIWLYEDEKWILKLNMDRDPSWNTIMHYVSKIIQEIVD